MFGLGKDRITFGKYKGTKFSELPQDYLIWLSENVTGFAKDKAIQELKKINSKYKENSTIIEIITSSRSCWKCKKNTKLISLRYLQSYGDIEVRNRPAAVYHQEKLPKELMDLLHTKFSFYKYKYSYTEKQGYIGNTCSHCGSLQGDWFLYDEPDGAFFNVTSLKANEYIFIKDGKLIFS